MAEIDPNVLREDRQVSKADLRGLIQAVRGRINTMPESWEGKAGRPLTVRAAEDGPTPISGPMHGDGQRVRGFAPDPATITAGTTAITQAGHLGRILDCNAAGAMTLQFSRTSDPESGIQPPFSCTIVRGSSAGQVSISLDDTLTLQGTDTKVVAGGMATVLALGSRLFLKGETTA